MVQAEDEPTAIATANAKAKSCKFYKMGRPRAVPYKGDSSSFDDGCLDEILTEGRS